jgi:hypothetical protein
MQSHKNDLQQLQSQNLKRSFSLGSEKSSQPYINPYAKGGKNMFSFGPANQHFSNIPPLVHTSRSNFNFKLTSDSMTSSQTPVSITKMPNISVKDPIKLFSNACSSIEILKIPQTPPQQLNFQPTVKNVKLNRPAPTTIPLEKIKQTAQIPSLQKILPQTSQNYIKPSSGPYISPKTEQTQNPIAAYVNPYQSSGQDISLEKYALELSQDIAKLDQSLSLEKNFEHWGKLKLQEFSKINEPKSFQTPPAKSTLSQQMNMSIRNIPNPSAIMMSRNQILSVAKPFAASSKDNEITSSSEHSDIEDISSKTTITKNNEKQVTPKVSDKRNIEKLTEYLKMSAEIAKAKGDDDNNNNNNSNASENNNNNNNTSKPVLEGSTNKHCNATDVICIDS